jgi:glycosyltransferase involved in cell wall biosynthesis
MVAQLERSRAQLAAVAGGADAVWAVSGYNARELVEAGVAEPLLFPLPFDAASLDVEPDPAFLHRRYREPLTNVLFVGRMAPNKCVEELILMYAHYYFNINPHSRLILVGSERSCPTYFAMLRTLAGELGLQNVCFERYVAPSGLAACYRLADVFVTASRHEGYCLPLLEAAHHGVPVVAREAGGMPEALDGAGVLYRDLGPALLAELVHTVITDRAVRREVIDSQARRLSALAARSMDQELNLLLKLA